jgi:LEA14-like dessication related protein
MNLPLRGPRWRRFLCLAPLLALLAPLSGCSGGLSDILSVNFDRLDVDSIDFEQADTRFVFRVDNPNPIGIELARFNYTLTMGDIEWVTGEDADGLVIEAASGSEVSLPVQVAWASLYDLVQANRGADSLPFTLEGSFGFDSPIGAIDLPYSAGGVFPALRAPAVGFKALRVEDYSIAGATLALDLDVDNDHASTLDFVNFDYAIELEGSTVAEGLVAELASVPGASADTVTLPIELDFLEAGMGLYDAISASRIDVGLRARTDVLIDTFEGLEPLEVPLEIDEAGRVDIDL